MSYKFFVYRMPVMGASIFIALNAIAIYFYGKPPYSFFDNYLSSMGEMYIKYNQFGTQFPNHISMIIWGFAMVMGGITISLFYNSLPKALTKEVNLGALPFYARYIGIVAGFFFLMIGLTPVDQVQDLHVFFAQYAFRILLLLSLIHTVIIFRAEMMPNRYAIGYMVFCFILAAYVILITFGPHDSALGKDYPDRTDWDTFIHSIHVISQKIIAITFIGSVIHQSFGLRDIYES